MADSLPEFDVPYRIITRHTGVLSQNHRCSGRALIVRHRGREI
jgi:hypothetical protein